MPRVAVVGHVEWVQFVAVERPPPRGGIAEGAAVREQAGGGAVVAAAVIAELGAETELFCALADDRHGQAALAELRARGITVHPAWRPPPTRRALTLLDAGGERTIVTVGDRLAPAGADAIGWERLDDVDSVYFTAGDDGALRQARRARQLVITPRVGDHQRGVVDPPDVDATVFSAGDDVEAGWARRWEPRSALMVATEGARGGRWWGVSQGRWDAAPAPTAVHDAYGCGDAFAAAFTFGLARGDDVAGAAAVGARAGAAMLGRVGAP